MEDAGRIYIPIHDNGHQCRYDGCAGAATLHLMTPEYGFDTVEETHWLLSADCGLYDAPATPEGLAELLRTGFALGPAQPE